jgi:nitroreductase
VDAIEALTTRVSPAGPVAAHALGFGGFWRTGAAAYDERVKRALELRAGDAIVGFLYLGTPSVATAPAASSDVASHVHDSGETA